jgi:hypothetical protein
MNDLKTFLMSLRLENLLSPLGKKTGKVKRILKGTTVLGYRSSTLKFFIVFKIFDGVGFLRFFSNL